MLNNAAQTVFDFVQDSCSLNEHRYSIRLLIGFHSYQKINDHSIFIDSILSNNHTYNIVPRNNIATKQYPTDFIIIQTNDENVQFVLNQYSNIKYVEQDRMIHKQQHRKLKSQTIHNNRGILGKPFLITEYLRAQEIWDDGFYGDQVKVAIFDTGIDDKHAHFNNIEERTNWTDEDQLSDGIGHGTFVAGIIASKFEKCPGFAPNALLHTFRVFSNDQMSYTSWFIDAFNYAIFTRMNILNLSIGGPDYLDHPFVDKVREMQANNVIMITACGNDGKYGTINNPADQMSVIGVGGITQNKPQQIAHFQSRGMTTWELTNGYGRVKPEVVTVGQSLYGSNWKGGTCRTLSGTSVASPVVAGVSALLISTIPEDVRWDLINPASLKQILVESSDTIDNLRLFEQGNGQINLINAYHYISSGDYQKHISSIPARLNFNDCPYFWPFCTQPLFHTSMPYIFNLTLLNPFSVTSKITKKKPVFEIVNIVNKDNGDSIALQNDENNIISIEFEHSDIFWPWCGWLALHITAQDVDVHPQITSVIVSGSIFIFIDDIDDELVIPFSLEILVNSGIPNRSKRLLFDQWHNLAYPHGYLPRDDLENDDDMLDWFGDHLHTNYHTLYDYLRNELGFFIEILNKDFSCFDADLYSALIIIDSEEEFHRNEIFKIRNDVMNKGLSVIIFADWYNTDLMNDVRFFDDNTRSFWDALTGGSNVPALNELLFPFGIQFGDYVMGGDIMMDNKKTYFQTGVNIIETPLNSLVFYSKLRHIDSGKASKKVRRNQDKSENVESIPLLLYDTKFMNGTGKIAAFGDSTCLDANQHRANCFWIMEAMLDYVGNGDTQMTNDHFTRINKANQNDNKHGSIPKRVGKIEPLFAKISKVHGMDDVECLVDFEYDMEYIQSKKKQANLRNVNWSEKSKYIHVVNPHLDGAFDDSHYIAMFVYPMLILVAFVVFLCLFCRPIRMLFQCQKIDEIIKNAANKILTTKQETSHFHI